MAGKRNDSIRREENIYISFLEILWKERSKNEKQILTDAVGALVGDTLGAFVGVFVGAFVGEVVGACSKMGRGPTDVCVCEKVIRRQEKKFNILVGRQMIISPLSLGFLTARPVSQWALTLAWAKAPETVPSSDSM